MKLRDHPLMTYRSVRNWPPVWTSIGPRKTEPPKGEAGILLDVVDSAAQSVNRCFLIIEYRREAYMGCLLFDDPSFCGQIAKLLLRYRSFPVPFVAGLDVGDLL